MIRYLPIIIAAGCAAPPIEPVSDLPDIGPVDAYLPPPDPVVYTGARPDGHTRDTTEPDIDRPGARVEVRVSAEICDLVDNDGDGLVDEGVANGCGECGGDRLDGTDDDCDGLVDERFLGAVCLDDHDCAGSLSCLDGWCSDPCPSTCDDCDRCVGHLLADDDALIVSPDCADVCAECRGRCDALGGVCVGGGCMRDGRRAGGCRPDETASVEMERWVDADGLQARLVDVCRP